MNNNLANNKGLQKLVQAGAVGLAFLLIILVAYIFNKYDRMANNHALEFTAAIKENTKTQEVMIEAVRGLEKSLEKRDNELDVLVEYLLNL